MFLFIFISYIAKHHGKKTKFVEHPSFSYDGNIPWKSPKPRLHSSTKQRKGYSSVSVANKGSNTALGYVSPQNMPKSRSASSADKCKGLYGAQHYLCVSRGITSFPKEKEFSKTNPCAPLVGPSRSYCLAYGKPPPQNLTQLETLYKAMDEELAIRHKMALEQHPPEFCKMQMYPDPSCDRDYISGKKSLSDYYREYYHLYKPMSTNSE